MAWLPDMAGQPEERSPAARDLVIALAGRALTGPQPGTPPVAAHHLSWHTRQVVRGAPRPATVT